ncbi:MAG: hypothetical protein CTY28_15975 [Hyphomicrobium sp.]|nr:MAG: hypothetical protein CTY28_15975 [Hyphomicrobium sp.]
MLQEQSAAIDELAPLYPNTQRPLRPDQIAFRGAFAAAFARTGNAPDSVREAVALCGGSAKSHRRPCEVARRLLLQEPVRARILELGGTLPTLDPAMVVAPRQPNVPSRESIDRPEIPPPVADPSRDLAQVSPVPILLSQETAARLAAVAFDPAMPPGVGVAALTALADACRRRMAEIGGSTER